MGAILMIDRNCAARWKAKNRRSMSSLDEAAAIEESVGLVEGIARGDRAAEATFVQRYLPRVRALLLARSRNPELTADLQQEVMIESLCALRRGQLREASKLASFVIGIARNLLNNYFRVQKRLPECEEFVEEIYLPVAEQEHEELERRELAARAIDSLEMVDRRILTMTLVDGFKPGVIAERLGLKADVVRQRKVRATRKVTELVRQLSQSSGRIHSITGQKS
jgi:RNA polymerase sigma factor (sigma-70 family)